MALEKRFPAVGPQLLTINGTSAGVVTIADASLFKVKQVVIIASNAQPNLEIEVKQVLSPTSMVVGPRTGNIFATTDISAYLTVNGANVFANEQRRPTISPDEFERATYEEEPTVAKRTILVDEFGNKITLANPLPTSATVNVPPITVSSTLIAPLYVTPGFNAKAVSFFYTGGGDLDRIETIIGTKKKIEQFTYNGGGDLTGNTVTIIDI